MSYLETANTTNDVIRTGQENPKGLIGVIALGVIAIGGLAIKAISENFKNFISSIYLIS